MLEGLKVVVAAHGDLVLKKSDNELLQFYGTVDAWMNRSWISGDFELVIRRVTSDIN